MAARQKLTLDPIACCTPVRTDALDEDQAAIAMTTSPPGSCFGKE